MIVGQSLQSTVPSCDRLAVDRAAVVHAVPASRQGGWPTSILACCGLHSHSFWTPISALSLPMSLKNSTIKLLSPLSLQFSTSLKISQIRAEFNTVHVDSKRVAPMWLPAYPTQGIKTSVVHPNELHRAQATGRIWSNSLQCVNLL